jgi:hypothetical protein
MASAAAAAGAEPPPYNIACAVFGHGLDLSLNPELAAGTEANRSRYGIQPASFYQRQPLPPGYCVVTAMRTGESANVFGHVDKLFEAFQDPANEEVLKNPGAPGNLARLKALFPDDPEQQVHIAEGDKGHTCSFFDWTLFLAGKDDTISPDDPSKGLWVVKSGIYEYPIRSAYRFKVAEDRSPFTMGGKFIDRIYDGSFYPTPEAIKTGLNLGQVVGHVDFSYLNAFIEGRYPSNNRKLISEYNTAHPGQRVVIYNFVCRASPAEFLGREMLTRSEIALKTALQAASLEQQQAYAEFSQSQLADDDAALAAIAEAEGNANNNAAVAGGGRRRYKKSRKQRKRRNKKNRKTRK